MGDRGRGREEAKSRGGNERWPALSPLRGTAARADQAAAGGPCPVLRAMLQLNGMDKSVTLLKIKRP